MEYIRIIEINSLQDLELIKLQFNKEDVKYRVLFERTLHLDGMYALGQRGAIIEVWEEHIVRASSSLVEMGYMSDWMVEDKPPSFIEKFDTQTKNIPIIGKWQVTFRLILIASVVVFFWVLILIAVSI